MTREPYHGRINDDGTSLPEIGLLEVSDGTYQISFYPGRTSVHHGGISLTNLKDLHRIIGEAIVARELDAATA